MRVCLIGFVTANLAGQSALQAALRLGEWFQANKPLTGVAYCLFRLKELHGGGLTEIARLLTTYDQAFVLQGENIYRVQLLKERLVRLPV
jgi:hypothetical protein